MTIDKTITDLGSSNGWERVPDIVKACNKAEHVTSNENMGRCLTRTTCRQCGYTYKTDSGD